MKYKYFVEYNCKIVGIYVLKSCALKFIKRKKYKNDSYNCVRLFDKNGTEYDTTTGKEVLC